MSETGTLQLNTRPWAEVYVDGEHVGHTPLRALTLPVGRHTLRLENAPMNMSKTVEVTNTDAEGRLILADALALAVEDEPDAVIDVATLTGPCIVALGDKVAGLFGDDETTAAFSAAADTSGELLWRLPIPDETRDAVRTESKIADVLQHNWVRWGSALFAAAFLSAFVGDKPWAHLDIAGPSNNKGGGYGFTAKGSTGVSVRTLLELAAVFSVA